MALRKCAHCGIEFNNQIRGGFCSDSCRFWNKVTFTESCWLFRFPLDKGGYGRIRFQGKNSAASHRVAWQLCNGPIPDGLWVLHKCDIPACCRPDHLFLGTHQDNVDDMMRKGRKHDFNGEAHPGSILTAKQVIEIQRKYMSEYITQRELGEIYGVCQGTISAIITKKTWGSIHHSQYTIATVHPLE